MKQSWFGPALAFLICAAAALSPAGAQTPPWISAAQTARATGADIQRLGIRGIESHVPELEKALAEGAAAFPPKAGADGKTVMLVTGPVEALAAMALAASQKVAAVAVDNPYPTVGVLLMEFYVEAGRPEDALRVQAATLRLRLTNAAGPADAALFTETAAAYTRLHRWDEALGASDTALKASQNDRDRARSQRSRGFALIELQRLDEAEAAYRESLKLEPGSIVALNELEYIARQRAGGPRAPSTVVTPEDATKLPPPQPVRPLPGQHTI